MQLHKTDLARAELRPGVRTLAQRERNLLLMADGSKSIKDFEQLFNGEGEQIALRLVSQGFLQADSVTKQDMSAQFSALPVAPATPMVLIAEAAVIPKSSAVSADLFEGKRSLATTRMFLFDICERMFARRNPDLCVRLRDALRDAKDRDSMLAVAREIMDEIEVVAGHERANSISKRLAMMLPLD